MRQYFYSMLTTKILSNYLPSPQVISVSFITILHTYADKHAIIFPSLKKFDSHSSYSYVFLFVLMFAIIFLKELYLLTVLNYSHNIF